MKVQVIIGVAHYVSIIEPQPEKSYLLICASDIWKVSSLSAWTRFAFLAIQIAPSEDSDQPARMRRLIRIFAGRMCAKIQSLMLWLTFCLFLEL